MEDHRVEVNPSRLALVSSELGAANTPIAIDVIGDGIPNVVVETYSGGVHCCFSYFIFELGEHFRLINHIDAGDYPIWFRQHDNEPGLEIKLGDVNFLYWKTGFAGSPVPRVLLKYRNGRDRPDPKLMREPPMALATLKKLAEEIKTSDRWDKNEDAPLPPRLWAVMLDLIYSGNMGQTREFLEMSWPPSRQGKHQFADKFFNCQLRRSHYWPTIAILNGMPPSKPRPDCPPGPESG